MKINSEGNDTGPYENSDMITAGVLLDIDRNFIFRLNYNGMWEMIKSPLKIPAGKFEKNLARNPSRKTELKILQN